MKPREDVPRTQRATAEYNPDGSLDELVPGGFNWIASIPVLVVPEAAVSGCKHSWKVVGGLTKWCRRCGGISELNDGLVWGRIQRPRILRVGRAKK